MRLSIPLLRKVRAWVEWRWVKQEARRFPAYPVEEWSLQRNIALNGALLGISTVMVAQLATKDKIDKPLMLAAAGFALCIPLLAFVIVHDLEAHGKRLQPALDSVIVAGVLGVLLCIAGLATVFWHFHPYIGVLFAGCSAISLVAWYDYSIALRQANSGPVETHSHTLPAPIMGDGGVPQSGGDGTDLRDQEMPDPPHPASEAEEQSVPSP